MRASVITKELAEKRSEHVAPRPRPAVTLSTAEVAECTCPEWCERDHELD
jgi:hypothetical protein